MFIASLTCTGRRIMQSLSAQLGIVDNTMTTGVQIFKLAAMNNFIQGRRMEVVSAVCLYSACRKNQPCKVMLIDFADKVQVCFSFPSLFSANLPRSMFSSWVAHLRLSTELSQSPATVSCLSFPKI